MQIVHIISGLGDGGAEAVLYRLLQLDKDYNHKVISLTGNQKYGSMIKDIGVDVYVLDILNKGNKISSLINLYKLIKKLKPDIVQTWMIHADLIGGLAAKLAGIKNIYWGVHHTKLEGGRLMVLIGRINAFLSYIIPTRIIYCAQKSREAQESIGFSKSKGVVVHNGYNVQEFRPNKELGLKLRDEFNISEKVFVIGHVGRYDPLKDLDNFFTSLLVLRKNEVDFKVLVAGTNLDQSNEDLLKLLRANDLLNHIYLLGIRNDIPSIMSGIDLFVLSSRAEAFPNVLNEAMACGTPCVSTNVGDCGYIIGETGWIVPSQDPFALGEAITLAANERESNANTWSQRQSACRQRIIEKFTVEKMVNKYKKIWIDF